jgi:hypothetical protein
LSACTFAGLRRRGPRRDRTLGIHWINGSNACESCMFAAETRARAAVLCGRTRRGSSSRTCRDRLGLARSDPPIWRAGSRRRRSPWTSRRRRRGGRARPPMQLRPERCLGPFGEAPMRGLVRDAEHRRQVPPRAPGGQHEHDRREALPVVDPGHAATLRTLRRHRDQRFGDLPQDLPQPFGHRASGELIHTGSKLDQLHAK